MPVHPDNPDLSNLGGKQVPSQSLVVMYGVGEDKIFIPLPGEGIHPPLHGLLH